jgi:universal stress protein A
MHNYRNLLVAVDFSNHSEQAVARAKQMAQVYSADLTLIHVAEVPTYPVLEDVAITGMPGIWDEELGDKIREAAEKRLHKMAEEAGVEVKACKVLTGVARVEVVDFAKQINADLIVIGRRGLSGLQRLIGSTADAILHDAACDVLAVKIDEGE